MTKMNDLSYDIEQMYIEGISPKRIAQVLECPIEMVYGWIDSNDLDVAENPQEDYNPFDTINS